MIDKGKKGKEGKGGERLEKSNKYGNGENRGTTDLGDRRGV
jgi:hypothetical protein